MFDYKGFLDSNVSFNGRNVALPVKKICSVVRVLIEKPKLLLLSEEALDFGGGIVQNFKQLEKRLRNSTIISITHRNDNIHAYNKLILMDGGTVIDRGEPKQLLADPKSFFYTYLKETDKKALRQQTILVGLAPYDQTRLESASRIPDLNGSLRETVGGAKEPQFSVFRQKDEAQKSPRSPLDSPFLQSPVKAVTTDKKSTDEPLKKKRSQSARLEYPLTRESTELLSKMCVEENNHQAIQMSARMMGPRASNRSIFGSRFLRRPYEKQERREPDGPQR